MQASREFAKMAGKLYGGHELWNIRNVPEAGIRNRSKFEVTYVNEAKDIVIGSFFIYPDPTCCGANILSTVTLMVSPISKDSEPFASGLACLFAAAEEVSERSSENVMVGIIYHTNSDSALWEAALRAGWDQVAEFENPNTENTVKLFVKVIFEAFEEA